LAPSTDDAAANATLASARRAVRRMAGAANMFYKTVMAILGTTTCPINHSARMQPKRLKVVDKALLTTDQLLSPGQFFIAAASL
jgi:hypothetical protein